jgi:nucleoside-diphosphate-sugar epimerase
MRRVVVIGATGHIGSYLVPRLVRGGHEVLAMSRGTRERSRGSFMTRGRFRGEEPASSFAGLRLRSEAAAARRADGGTSRYQ